MTAATSTGESLHPAFKDRADAAARRAAFKRAADELTTRIRYLLALLEKAP
jgi:transcription elongation GreA/GreB family factor